MNIMLKFCYLTLYGKGMERNLDFCVIYHVHGPIAYRNNKKSGEGYTTHAHFYISVDEIGGLNIHAPQQFETA